METFVVGLLAVCGLAQIGWAFGCVTEARAKQAGVVASEVRQACHRRQMFALLSLGVTGMVLIGAGAGAAYRWVVLLVIAAPFWGVLMWATLRLRRRYR